MSGNIVPLAASTRAQLRSTQILTSLSQVVSELVQNSLDAGARHVEIGLDCEDWTCWVKDNGHGISKDDLGKLGEGRYGSSKAYNPDSLNVTSSFGFRGEALASAAGLGCLEICSRTARSRKTWSTIVKEGSSLYFGPAVRWQRETPGTVVCIRDAFYNLPVRRRSHTSPARTLEIVRHELETYALMFPHVSFSLENTHKEGTSARSAYVLRIPKTGSTVDTFRHLYGRAMTEHIERVDETEGGITIDGFISLDGSSSKAYQFLYVNKHPVSHGDLHNIINQRFTASSYSRFANIGKDQQPLGRRSPTKAEKRPVYVLNVTIASHEVDRCLEPAKNVLHFQNKTAVEKMIASVIQNFLVRHHFASDKSRDDGRLHGSQGAPPRKRIRLDSSYDQAAPGPTSVDSTRVPSSLSIRQDVPSSLFIRQDETKKPEGSIVWTDPTTGGTFLRDSRTGHCLSQVEQIERAGDSQNNDAPNRQGRRTIANVGPQSRTPEWIREALESNDAYANSENCIPSATLPFRDAVPPPLHRCRSLGSLDRPPAIHAQRSFLFNRSIQDSDRSIQQHFDRSDLLQARVVQQVDRKFIACAIETKDRGAIGPMLVLIDQHAADERIRVESLLKALCFGHLQNKVSVREVLGDPGVNFVGTRTVDPPVSVVLTAHEASRLSRSSSIRAEFADWGFYFDLASEPNSEVGMDATYAQVNMVRIPEVVSDKLLQGGALQELVQGLIVRFATSDIAPRVRAVGDEHSEAEEERNTEMAWVKGLRECPRELLDVINSKACRGAIMFNDTLSLAQCERLVRQLADAVFPFQCAHGRPSVAAVADLGKVGKGCSERSGRRDIRWDAFLARG